MNVCKSEVLFAWMILLGWPQMIAAQIQVSFPTNRAVIQRTTGNSATIRINGYYTSPAINRIDARVQARDGQGLSSDWMTLQANPQGGIYAGDLTVQGGWYNLEVRGMNDDQPIGSTTIIERVGVGEVFIVAGQSNAQGIYDDMPSASDDRVNSMNYFDASQSQQDPPSASFGRFTHLNQGNRLTPRGLGTWCWGKLGDLLAQRLNVPILFLNAAYEGAAIKNWRESIEKGRSKSIYASGYYYQDGQPYANLRIALQFFANMLGVRAILWQQGEAENFIQTTSSAYVNDLQFIINRSRQDCGQSIPWVVARVSYTGDAIGNRPEIITAQNQVITETPNVFAGPQTDAIQIPRQRPPRTAATFDDVHFDTSGLIDLATAWNNSLNNAFFGAARPKLPAPAPTISVSCAGNNQLIIRLNGEFSSVNWSSGENGQTLVKGAGDYQAKVKDNAGNVTFSPVVRVANAPVILASGPTTFCAGGSLSLSSSYELNNLWTTQATDKTIAATRSGNYAVRYRDVSGCDFTSAPVAVLVNPLPATPSLSSEKSTTLCEGEHTTLTANVGNVQYTWNSGQNSRSIDVTTAGAYTLRVTDQNGCTSPLSPALSVIVHPLPAMPTVTTSGATTFCADQRVTLMASPEEIYRWSTGQTNQAITINQSGIYTLQTLNRFNCLSTPSAPITVLVNPLPPAPILTANGLTTFCEGGQVSLTAGSILKPFWTTGDSTQTIFVKQSGTFTAKVRDQNGCFSPLPTGLAVAVKPLPSVPTLNQVGTYTLEATSAPPSDYYDWYRDADFLPVQTAVIKATRSGAYSARAFIRYSPSLTCVSKPSGVFNFTADEANRGLSVYPNPSRNGDLTLETINNLSNAVVSLYTLTGQLVRTIPVPLFDERIRLNLTTMPPGQYILQVKATNFNVAKRLLIGL